MFLGLSNGHAYYSFPDQVHGSALLFTSSRTQRCGSWVDEGGSRTRYLPVGDNVIALERSEIDAGGEGVKKMDCRVTAGGRIQVFTAAKLLNCSGSSRKHCTGNAK